MEFNISTCQSSYTFEGAEKLRSVGIVFTENDGWFRPCESTVNISSLEELLVISDRVGELIVSRGGIVIHDGYVE